MKRLILAVSIILIGWQAASAQTAEQRRNALNHVAQASAIADRCPAWKTDNVKAAIILTTFKIEIGKGEKDFNAMVEAYREARARIAEEDDAMVCALASSLYGPHGANVKGLMVQ